MRGLVERGAIGLVTTHDLALARDRRRARAARARTSTSRTSWSKGAMEFDYRLRPGVVTRGNALELMRAMGLVE